MILFQHGLVQAPTPATIPSYGLGLVQLVLPFDELFDSAKNWRSTGRHSDQP